MSWIPTRIEVPRPLPGLTYLAPAGLAKGTRVRVKVRNAQALGVVIGAEEHPPPVKLKPIESVVDPFPLLPPAVQSLLEFTCTYYDCSLAHLISLALPAAVLPDWEDRLPEGRQLIELRESGAWGELLEIGQAWHEGRLVLPRLFHKRSLRGAGITEVRRTQVPHPLKVRPTQAKVLLALETAGGAMLEEDLLGHAQVSASVLSILERDGLIERTKRVDLLSQKREEFFDKQIVLNQEQGCAVERVALGAFGTYLLFGVTGSGKTEVYLTLAEKVLEKGQRVLWLVPEIGLTPRLLARLEARFPGKVAVGHAGLNATEKQADVMRLLCDGAPIFVGVRNAVMAPLRNTGLIIVDEEQEASYKSEEHPRIHARDLAIKRAQLESCPVILGSATPSLESWHAANSGRYQLLQLTQRPAGSHLPVVEVVDLRLCYQEARKKVVFSPRLVQGLQSTLDHGEQAMLLLNRRGFENFWLCRACGKSLDCPHCSISLTYHKGPYRLRCHMCGYETVPPEVCPHCNTEHLRGVGEGTEQIEDQLRALFPQARILRLDRDTTQRKGSFEAGLLAAENGEVDILVGTQMLAKGHTFPRLTLVGILNADMGLKVADFRASERTFHLLTQVAGRAGRAELPGKVILQTYSPDHPAVKHAVSQHFEAFAAEELTYRQAMAYPPYTFLSLYRGEGDTPEAAAVPLAGMKEALKGLSSIRMLGPLEAPVAKVKDRYRMQLILKSWTRQALGEAVKLAPVQPGGSVSLDRDPLAF